MKHMGLMDIPMASRGDEVEHGMDTVVTEPRVTLDSGLLGENVIILPLEVTDDLGKAAGEAVRSWN